MQGSLESKERFDLPSAALAFLSDALCEPLLPITAWWHVSCQVRGTSSFTKVYCASSLMGIGRMFIKSSPQAVFCWDWQTQSNDWRRKRKYMEIDISQLLIDCTHSYSTWWMTTTMCAVLAIFGTFASVFDSEFVRLTQQMLLSKLTLNITLMNL